MDDVVEGSAVNPLDLRHRDGGLSTRTKSSSEIDRSGHAEVGGNASLGEVEQQPVANARAADNGIVAAHQIEAIAVETAIQQATQEDLERAARLADAHAFLSEMPSGYDTQLGERGGALSGGQRQRIAIARALVADPSILIFDEATSALDYETEADIIDRLPEILEGKTAIMIAHRLNTMRCCDRIVVLEQGAVIEEGNHDALMAQGGRYAELWRLQNE